ncbi:LysR family transcriptional regulator [Nocardioides sp. KR10-350]|uniref:LysR family transcriptional regulator n=1 Tax=Nocardioides cheoyonin TaxID=3156615 RepID=UPI0032B53A19
MDPQHLRYYLAVIDHGSINAAANAVGVAQPTISQAMRSLERELKTPLFHRIGRGMVPTSAGHALVSPARKVLRDIATAAGSVPDAEGHLRGRVDVRAHPAVSTGLLPRLVAEFHRRHPKVRVTIGTMYDESRVASLLRNAVCEIVVTHLPLGAGGEREHAADERELDVLELGTQVYAIALPPEEGSPARGTLRWDELDSPMVVVPQGTYHAGQLFRAMSPQQQARRPAVVLQNREARLAFALAGVGPTWIEQSATEVALQRGARIRTMEPPLPAPYGLVYDSDSLSPAAAAFVELAAQLAETDTSASSGSPAASEGSSVARNAEAAGGS